MAIKIIPFNNQGITTRLEPKALPPGSFQYLLNVGSEVEGSIVPRRGRKLLGTMPGAANTPHTCFKAIIAAGEVPAIPSTNPRFVGEQADIWETFDYVNFTKVNPSGTPACTTPTSTAISRFWTEANYSAGSSGQPAAYFACELAMLRKVQFNIIGPLSVWGIMQAAGVAQAQVAPGNPVGNLDGGASGSPSGSVPYSYVYSYRDPITGSEGNPSQVMTTDSQATNGIPLAVHLQQILVTIPVVPFGLGAAQSIALYRSGGILNDGLYRFLGYPTQAISGLWQFTDNVPDASLAFQLRQAEFDNDPPVVSSLQVPYIGTLTGPAGTGLQTINISPALPAIMPGTLVTFSGGQFVETCVINGVLGGPLTGFTNFACYCQYPHVAGEIVEIDANYGQPCNLALQAFDSIFVAGDPNNPHVLYKSKTGLPMSFPIVDALGNAGSVNVGSPANPIVAICEFRGNVLCLNAQNLFEVQVFEGIMLPPVVTPAQRGLMCMKAFCIADGAVWYLSYDGIWSWSGGASQKMTEAIDGIFHGISVSFVSGDMVSPINMDPHAIQWARLVYCRKQVHFSYPVGPIGVGNPPLMQELVYDLTFQRWLPNNKSVPTFPPLQQTNLFSEIDTGNLIYFRQGNNGGVICLDDALDSAGYTSDEFSTNALNQGNGIAFDAVTGWLDLGNEYMAKVFDEIFLDIDPQGTPGNTCMQVDVYYDYSTVPGDTFNLPGNTNGRTLLALDLALAPDPNQPGTPYSTYGRQASVIAFEFVKIAPIGVGAQGYRPTLYGIKFNYREVGELASTPYMDWDDRQYKYDKRFYEFTVEFDTNLYRQGAAYSRISIQLVLDTIGGVTGATITQDVQTFTLKSSQVVPISPSRALATFPIIDGVVAKMVRLRTLGSGTAGLPNGTFFRIVNVDWQYEKYPADIVPFSEWKDGGYAYLKYGNQIDFDVDTNNQQILVQIQIDGGGTAETIAIQTNQTDRNRNVALQATTASRKWRWFVDTTPTGQNAGAWLAGGKFQVFSAEFQWQKADKGEIIISKDWDDLGHPFDKRLFTITFEWDTSVGGSVVMQLDTINGIGGGTLNTNVAQFTLSGGRSKAPFPLAPDIIAKLVRVYPVSSVQAGFRQWSYSISRTEYPPDIIESTEWKYVETPDDKNPSWLSIDADTQGIPATVELENETGVVMTVHHTGTISDRKFNYPIAPDILGKMWRLLITIGAGGKYQQFSWGFRRWQPTPLTSGEDPPDIVLWTPWSDLGWPYGKIARNLILTVNTGGIAASVTLQSQEGASQVFSVNTTYDTRRVVIACNPNLEGTLWRIIDTPGAGGIFKLWNWELEHINEPAAVTQWTSYEQTFGVKFWKLMFQTWWMYRGASPLNLTIVSETGTFSITLPPHANRTEERFLLPSVFGAGLNKSRVWSLSITSFTPFQFWAEGSGIEFIVCGEERHAVFHQMTFSEALKMGEG